VRTASICPATSPSYVLAHPTKPWVFAAGEGAPATASSYRIDESGGLHELSTLRTGGEAACHLALTSDGAHLLVANYGSGSVTSFAVGDDGTLSGPLDHLGFTGSGPQVDRQEGPHAHQTLLVDSPDGTEVLVCDLGTDRIHRLALDPSGRFRRAADPVHLPPGAGPRHAVLVADRLVVACELNAELWVGRREGDAWVESQRIATTAAAGSPRQPSGVASDGRTVVVATRGPDTVTTFDLTGGMLRVLAEVPCGGAWPRALTLRDRWLWVANQTSGTVTALDLSDPAAPTLALEFEAPSATCVALLPAAGPEIA
jgi:6-phosphogluconolactonase